MATGLLSECISLFQCSDLYQVLGVEKLSTPKHLKKAYYSKSLLVHPDRNSTDTKEVATKKFQILAKIYAILSDADKRSLYDESGEIEGDDIDLPDECQNWVDYWRLLFPPVTTDMIDDFSKTYKESDSERNDLKKIYLQYEGDMDSIMDSMLLASFEDEDRYRDIINQLIKANDVPSFDAFTHEPTKKRLKRKRAAEKENKDFAVEQTKMETTTRKKGSISSGDAGSSVDSLAKQIAARQQDRMRSAGSFLDQLADKYCKPTAKKSRQSKKKK